MSANVIGILIWAKCIKPPMSQAAAGKSGGVEHSTEHVTALLEKFFPASSTMDQAITYIERAGYQMEFNPEIQKQMISSDPFTSQLSLTIQQK